MVSPILWGLFLLLLLCVDFALTTPGQVAFQLPSARTFQRRWALGLCCCYVVLICLLMIILIILYQLLFTIFYYYTNIYTSGSTNDYISKTFPTNDYINDYTNDYIIILSIEDGLPH